jgi:hypothetical protein
MLAFSFLACVPATTVDAQTPELVPPGVNTPFGDATVGPAALAEPARSGRQVTMNEDDLRIRVAVPEGVLLIYDAANPLDQPRERPGYVALWHDAGTELIYLSRQLVFDSPGVGAALQALERELGVPLPAVSALDEKLWDAWLVAEGAQPTEPESSWKSSISHASLWQLATPCDLLEVMGFELLALPELTGDSEIPCAVGKHSTTAGGVLRRPVWDRDAVLVGSRENVERMALAVPVLIPPAPSDTLSLAEHLDLIERLNGGDCNIPLRYGVEPDPEGDCCVTPDPCCNCAGPCCNGACCGAGVTCCAGRCCHYCCGSYCCRSPCCPTVPGGCCTNSGGILCCGPTCCVSGQKCCPGPPQHCCAQSDLCCGPVCCEIGDTCCGPGVCCNPGEPCCPGQNRCCPVDTVCCGLVDCCMVGEQCCGGQICCPEDWTCFDETSPPQMLPAGPSAMRGCVLRARVVLRRRLLQRRRPQDSARNERSMLRPDLLRRRVLRGNLLRYRRSLLQRHLLRCRSVLQQPGLLLPTGGNLLQQPMRPESCVL